MDKDANAVTDDVMDKDANDVKDEQAHVITDDVAVGDISATTDSVVRPIQAEETLACRQCEEEFPSLSRLNQHRCSRVDDMLRCAKCQEMFLRPDYYKHVEYCNRQPDVKTPGFAKANDVFCCLICSFRGLTLNHHREVHCAGVGGKAFGCSACSYKSNQRQRVFFHVRETKDDKHKNSSLQRCTELLQCTACSETFRSEDAYNQHYRETHCVLIRQFFWCDDCKRWLDVRRESQHWKLEHRGELYTCDVCGKTYKTEAVLRGHLHSHQEKRFHCMCCPARFTQPKALRQHFESVHETKCNNVKCPDNGKCFKTPAGLKEHIAAQHQDRPQFKCHVCGKLVTTKHSLQQHLLTHSEK